MTDHQFVAIEITSPAIADIVKDIKPELREHDYETELRFNFLVLGFPRSGEFALVQPNIFNRTFDHIVNGPEIMLKTFVRRIVNDDPLHKEKTYVQRSE